MPRRELARMLISVRSIRLVLVPTPDPDLVGTSEPAEPLSAAAGIKPNKRNRLVFLEGLERRRTNEDVKLVPEWMVLPVGAAAVLANSLRRATTEA